MRVFRILRAQPPQAGVQHQLELLPSKETAATTRALEGLPDPSPAPSRQTIKITKKIPRTASGQSKSTKPKSKGV